MGSTREAKKAPVENMANAIEILACLMDSKKVIQCNAMKMPAIENFKMTTGLCLKFVLVAFTNKNINTTAITILNQTNGTEPMVISSPKIAVKPAIKTRK